MSDGVERPISFDSEEMYAYPLLRIDTTLDSLAGSMLFTTLDLASGYWQVEVNADQMGI